MRFAFDDPDNYVPDTPYETLARLRKETPFAWNEAFRKGGPGFWLALRHSDIVAISKNPKVFGTSAVTIENPLPRALWSEVPSLAMVADQINSFEPEKHAAFRFAVNPLFSGTNLAELKDTIRRHCVEIIGRIDAPEFDFARKIALAVPLEIVLGTFMGIPPDAHEKLARCVFAINGKDDPLFSPTSDAATAAVEELWAYGTEFFRQIERRPGPGVLGKIVSNENLAEVPPRDRFFAFWFPLIDGAFDTLASTIAGGMHAFLQHPEQLVRLRRDPSLIPSAVGEVLRFVSPAIYFARTATTDTTFHGHAIRKGQKVVMCYASGNRDETVFPNPDEFDVGRPSNNHLSFGFGPHACLGARLATLILRIFLEETAQRMPELQLNGTIKRTRSFLVNRIHSLPVKKVSRRAS